MGNIGASIFDGVMGALGHALSLIPLGVWLFAGMALLAIVFILRYATNWKVDVAAVVVFFLISEALVIRAHWIGVGRAQVQAQLKTAQEQVAAYKKTNELVIACYAQNRNATVLWDRTNGDCITADGSK